jgi:O-acetyl-ADP-ribose deacetylase (regulator of RNase III)
VIHTVGPVWKGGLSNEAELLVSCYKRCFELALKKMIKSMAFPAISTGVYGFPKQEAAAIAICAAKTALTANPQLEKVIMVCFNHETRQAYEATLQHNGG